MTTNSSIDWKKRLGQAIADPSRILTGLLERTNRAGDASFYRLVPQVVVLPDRVSEVQQLFEVARETGTPMTFCTARTSLSGQANTNGILVDCSQHWSQIEVLDEGARVRVQPGVIAAKVNAHLAPYARKIGPDPASIDSCMIGGVVSNNSSGMCCGVEFNSFNTIESMTFVLPNGLRINTADWNAEKLFRQGATEIHSGLLAIRSRIIGDAELKEKIESKYRVKNTTGYSLNAFTRYETAVDIMAHLLIGAEGTLGFIEEVVFRTIPSLPVRYTGLLCFDTIQYAAAAIAPLRDAGAAALELMDRSSLRSIESKEGMPDYISRLSDTAAAILVEFQYESTRDREQARSSVEKVFSNLTLAEDPDFTSDPAKQAALWKVRKGLLPSVGAIREKGTPVIIEDVTFPLPVLAEATLALQDLFREYEYTEAGIFGHAKDGNYHFCICPNLDEEASRNNYARFMHALAKLVLRYDGALKSEHGTGRNVAPWVKDEWGETLYEIMWELKNLIDPEGILNPGVILNRDPECFLKDIKQMPAVSFQIDSCLECGFCQRVCPSRDITTTPRSRISLLRALQTLACADSHSQDFEQLHSSAAYAVYDTCVGCGLCETACPVGIDTGALVKELRTEHTGSFGRWLAKRIAKNFEVTEKLFRMLLKTSIPLSVLKARSKRRGQPAPPAMLRPASGRLPFKSPDKATIVYFPCCLTRTMAPAVPEAKSLPEVMMQLLGISGRQALLPKNVHGTCCGQTFASKGYTAAYLLKLCEFIDRAWQWSREGQVPIVLDTSSCVHQLRTCQEALDRERRRKYDSLQLLDTVEFARDILLPARPVQQKLKERVALHPPCSITKLGLSDTFIEIARTCVETAVVPINAGCCGMAGDRGLLYPELTATATRAEAAEVIDAKCDAHYGTSLTCDHALSMATGQQYLHLAYLLERATR